ncbi:MAG TPA: N-acetyltransferase [Deltaproteobacteria bacterium]|nr:N-acetyltransferase [Deltaproteobacteria bacterium]
MIRKAVTGDVKEMAALVETFARRGDMLPRPLSEIYDNLRDFFVCRDGEELVGLCALHVCSEELGEIRTLAVKEERFGSGVGRSLVTACLEEARSLGLKRVFALTYRTAFFEKLGFRPVAKEDLPHKIWGECIRCVKFPNCDENAVIIDIA